MTEERVLTVLIVPKGWKQPGRGKGGQRFTLPTQREFKMMVRAAWQAKYPNAEVWQGPIKMMFTAWMPRPKGLIWKKKAMPALWHTKAPDLTNMVKLSEDALSGLAFKDDKLVCQQHTQKKIVPGLLQPQIHIKIEELE